MASSPRKPNKNLTAMTLGLNMVAGMVIFSLIGYAIDQKRGQGDTFTFIGIFLGLFYCGYEVWKIIRHTREE